MVTLAWHSAFLPGSAIPFLNSCFWERHPESKCFPAVIKIKDEGNYLFLCLIFMGIYNQSREEENPSSTCQRACQLLLCFTLLLGHSLMGSTTSALTLWLDVTQFLFHTKQRRVSSWVSQCILARSKLCADEGRSSFFWLISSLSYARGFSLVWFTVLGGVLILFPDQAAVGRWKLFPPRSCCSWWGG